MSQQYRALERVHSPPALMHARAPQSIALGGNLARLLRLLPDRWSRMLVPFTARLFNYADTVDVMMQCGVAS